ncbi:hypothetical protein [Enterovirga aerilata]|uniref:hypothetical protein n=1 Tax=Enterovirga aerilata TaxID=2730920 RepID=UPI001AED8ECC|nr:hypothetical protein [Enterovirga sp. DB1703]
MPAATAFVSETVAGPRDVGSLVRQESFGPEMSGEGLISTLGAVSPLLISAANV